MKQADINRLEKAVTHYQKIEKLLDDTCESIYQTGSERFNSECTTYNIVRDMLKSATHERSWLEGKINALKELVTK